MEELHTGSIDGGHEARYGARSRARERAYSNNSDGGGDEGCPLNRPRGFRPGQGFGRASGSRPCALP
jgi:hypothetical protein